MKWVTSLFIAMSLSACDTQNTISSAACSNAAQMHGSWDVALLFDVSKPPSSTTMKIEGEGSNQVTGSFYGSPFESAEMTNLTGQFIIAAETSDGTGKYIHMARYSCGSDRFEGQTWSRGRGFLMSWTAERVNG